MKPQQLMMMVVPDGELDQQSLPHRCASAPGLERTETRERRVSCLLGQPGGAACLRVRVVYCLTDELTTVFR